MHRIEISMLKNSRTPCVVVPHESIWSLVEYLAIRRVQADFNHNVDDCLAVFSHLSAESAQQILDDWAAFEADTSNGPVDDNVASDSHQLLLV